MSTLDLDGAAKLLKVHPKTLQKLARLGRVPACKVGRAWVFVERLLLEHLESASIARAVAIPVTGVTECPSTDARTPRIGGSSSPLFRVNRDLYSKALGLPTRGRRSKFTTDSASPVGSKPDLA